MGIKALACERRPLATRSSHDATNQPVDAETSQAFIAPVEENEFTGGSCKVRCDEAAWGWPTAMTFTELLSFLCTLGESDLERTVKVLVCDRAVGRADQSDGNDAPRLDTGDWAGQRPGTGRLRHPKLPVRPGADTPAFGGLNQNSQRFPELELEGADDLEERLACGPVVPSEPSWVSAVDGCPRRDRWR
jgi:hypothetical protein